MIGARNVLTTNDLAVAGWTGAHLDSVGNGTAQFAKACEHGSERGMGDGEVTAVYVRGPDGADEFGQQSTFSFGIPPQERAAYRRINGFYRDCPRSTVRRLPTPAGVDGDVWRIRAGQPGGDAYAVVVRVGDRIGWASLYDLRKPVAPSQVPSLATALDRRLRR